MEMASQLLYDKIKERFMNINIDFIKLRQWHENLTWEVADFFGLDEYEMLWVSYTEGLALGLLLWWIF